MNQTTGHCRLVHLVHFTELLSLTKNENAILCNWKEV